jgi:hypothetical protein
MHSEGSDRPGQGNSANGARAFLITIDTEGDDLWSKPRDITVRNAEVLPRFQELCEQYGLRPTYLANWEMANSASFVEFGRDVLKRDAAEIGMHLHAWNSPPLAPLTEDDYKYQPYLMEYPEDLIREKVKIMTDTLESTFGVKMVSHRAGRWGLNETYAQVLIDAGYRVDCSVTPNKNWRATRGDPAGNGGPDYRHFPGTAYFMDPRAIDRPGSSPLLQVPLTILPIYESVWARSLRASAGRVPYIRRRVYQSVPKYSWLQPVGNNSARLVRILSVARARHRDYVEFVVHSSELMAGGAPWLPTQDHIEEVYENLEVLFDASTRDWHGRTLSEYHSMFASSARAGSLRGSD